MDGNQQIQDMVSRMFVNGFTTNQIKPISRRRKTQPSYYKDHNITSSQTNDKLFTRFKAWVLPPTLEYPTASAFIGMGNGNGSVYCRISLEEFKELNKWLSTQTKIIGAELEAFGDQEAVLIRQRDETEKMISALKLAAQTNLEKSQGEVDTLEGDTEPLPEPLE